ncbi:MAG: protoporphyrinogen oxidase [Chlamydiales bacterium]|nr:protoporphyrinogen oxidase [Chlamydiales bacterium]
MTKKIAIIGAGICGLALAHFIQKFNPQIECTIFEAQDKVGGWLQTKQHNGAIFECGPRSLRQTSIYITELLQDLGLDKEVLMASKKAKRRFLAQSGHLESLPTGLGALFTTKLGRKVLFAIVQEAFSAKGESDDETVQSFFERRIGKGATDTFISALCAGIYASCPEELSMRSCFPELWQKEQDYGSLIKAKMFGRNKKPKIQTFTLKKGIGSLPEALAKQLKGSLYLNTKVISVQEGADTVHIVADKEYEFDHVYSTIAPESIAKMLPDTDELKPFLAIPATSVVTVSLAFTTQYNLPAGFGFLCPRYEDGVLLGIVFDSEVFPQQNGIYKTRLSVMLGGTRCPDMIAYSDDVVMAYVKTSLHKYLHIDEPSDYHIITRAEGAISRYPVGHYRTINAFMQDNRRLTILGGGLNGVGVGDAVTAAYCAAKKSCKPEFTKK